MAQPGTAPHRPLPQFTDEYWKALIDCGYEKRDDPFVAQFGRLSQLNIAYLFNELIKIKADIRNSGKTDQKQMHRLSVMLHHYTNALRDYQYLQKLPPLPDVSAFRQRTALERVFENFVTPQTQTPNNAAGGAVNGAPQNKNYPYDNEYLSLGSKPTQRSDPIREFLKRILPRQLSWTLEERTLRQPDYSRGANPEIYSKSLDKIARFMVGVVGGASLIVPLLIMAFHSSLTKTMITVCVAVVLFALAVSLLFELDNKDTVTATATYAAVLVVFVGTSTNGS